MTTTTTATMTMTATLNGVSTSPTKGAARRLHAAEEYAELLDKYDNWLFDCDGVLWRGNTLIDGASEFLQLLRSKSLFVWFRRFVGFAEFTDALLVCVEKSVIFVTNNASTSRKSYKKKFDKLGIEAHVVRLCLPLYALCEAE